MAIDLAPVVKFVRSRTNAKGRTVDLCLAAMIVVVGLAALIVVVGLAAVIVVVGLAAVIVCRCRDDSRDRRSRSRDRRDDSRERRRNDSRDRRRDDRGDGGGKRGYSPVHRRGQSPPLSPSPVKDILSPTIPSPSEKLKELEESGDSIAN